jgi:ABC-type sugar transport system substrate-binding protein
VIDLKRETDEKTSSVHFMRFEFTPEMISALKDGAEMKAGVDHAEYQYEMVVDDSVRQSLVGDFD